MAETIQDGTGAGFEAKVDPENRLSTTAVTTLSKNQANEEGRAFNINTLDVTLTTASKSAVFYIKNNEDDPLHIPKFTYIIGTSTGGTGDFKVEILRNPAAGTIISTATVVGIVSNRNYGSSNILTADAFKGAEGATLTDGAKSVSTILANTGSIYSVDSGEFILAKGSSLGIEITPPTGNTSLAIQIAIECYIGNT